MIRWEEEFGEYVNEHVWLGYLGKVIICEISFKHDLFFCPTDTMDSYTKLSSAKRGAERMLKAFLRDAGLAGDDGKGRAELFLAMVLAEWQRRFSFLHPLPSGGEIERHAEMVVNIFLHGALNTPNTVGDRNE